MLGTLAGNIDSDRIFKQFDLVGRLAVVAAVSGGSDLLALLFLLKDFVAHCAPQARLVAVTIDHQLRIEAATEAAAVAALCRNHGIAHRTLRWSGAKPAAGLPAAAREARYRLLAEAAAVEGTDLVLTGHTLDDQIETVEMRRSRGDGRGMAGMAPATLYDGHIWILRPLLDTARAALRDFLHDRDVAWIDDPTNVDAKYERTRLRATAPRSDAALAPIAAAARQRVELGADAAELIRTHVRLAAPGLIAVDRNFAGAADRDAAIYAVRILLAIAGGSEQLPDRTRAAALFGGLALGSFRATLSHAVVDARRDAIFVRRENRGLPGERAAGTGDIWDGRYRLGQLPDGAAIAPLGLADASALLASEQEEQSRAAVPASLRRAALAVEPALWQDGHCQGLACEAGAAQRIIAPWARFLPSFDLEPARAVAALLGADIPPEPPFAGHKERKG